MDALLSPPADRKLAIVAQGSASEVRQREVSWFAAVAEMTITVRQPSEDATAAAGRAAAAEHSIGCVSRSVTAMRSRRNVARPFFD